MIRTCNSIIMGNRYAAYALALNRSIGKARFSFYNIKGFCYLAFHSEGVVMINKENGFNLNINWYFPGGREYAFAFIALFVFLIIIYANSFHGAWQFDDQINIVENNNIHLKIFDWSTIQKTFYGIESKKVDRPLSFLSFALNYHFNELDVFGYHLINFLIHYFTAIFLFLFIYQTLKLPTIREQYGPASYSIALLSSILWATSPLQVTAVTYIVQRMASMAGLFYIMCMYFYLKGRTSERSIHAYLFFGLSILSAVLSLGTKENAIMLPFSIWLFDILLIQSATRKNIIRNLKLFVPLTLVALVICLWYVDITSIISGASYKNRPFTLIERLLTQPRVIIFYITLLCYPVSSRLTLIHDIELSTSFMSPWSTIPAILLILSFLILAFYLSRKKPLVSFCIIFFFLNHIVEGSFIPLELIYEHRNYIPSFFFFVPLSIGMVMILDYFAYRVSIQIIMVSVFTFFIFAQGHTVFLRNSLFSHPLLLWSDNIKKTTTLSRPYNNLGAIYWDMGFYDKAFEFYSKAKALDRQTNLTNRGINLHNLGMYYLNVKGDYNKALTLFQSAIEAYPGYWPSYNDAAVCFIRKGDFPEAGRRITTALRLWPENADLRHTLSFILFKMGEYDEATKQARRVLILKPDLYNSFSVLGEAYRYKGNYLQSTYYWKKYLERYPNDLEANFVLLELYARQNKQDDLSQILSKLLSLKKSKNWCELLEQIKKENRTAAYIPRTEEIIPIIEKNFAVQICR